MQQSEDYDEGFFSIHQIIDVEGCEENIEAETDASDSSSSNSESENEPENENQDVNFTGNSKPELKLPERKKMVDKLLILQDGDNLPWGTITKIAREFKVHRSTVHRILRDAKKQRTQGDAIDVRTKKIGKVGRKPKQYDEHWLQSVPLHSRTTLRSFASALKVSHSTVYKLLKRGKLRRHTSNNHPTVKECHKLARMKWVLAHIIPGTRTLKPIFVNMHNVIHIDEKWFYLNPDLRRFYLLPSEDDPYRCCQSKRHKIKAMFMCATSRPITDMQGNMIHDGKFGIFPFVNKVAAKKKSKNRAKGTIETKAITNVNQPVMRDMLINQVIPAIKQKWPSFLSKDIYIQQDNAKPHISPTDSEFTQVATSDGFNIQLICQPPQSPDLNVLDLGFFRAIQALQYQSFPKDLNDLIEKVKDAYACFDPHVLKYTWLQLQYVMVEVLKVKGGNNYKNPHKGKQRLERLGLLPENVEVDQDIIDEAVQYLNERIIPVHDDMFHFENGEEVDAH